MYPLAESDVMSSHKCAKQLRLIVCFDQIALATSYNEDLVTKDAYFGKFLMLLIAYASCKLYYAFLIYGLNDKSVYIEIFCLAIC